MFQPQPHGVAIKLVFLTHAEVLRLDFLIPLDVLTLPTLLVQIHS